jgi:cellulose synthase (UDP-forming)
MRTPKVRNRTVPAFMYVVLPYLLVGWSVYTFKVAYQHDLWSNAVFAAINGLLGGYAIVSFIGIRDSIVDIWVNVTSWLYKPQGPKKMAARAPAATEPTDDGVANWELVLYLGHADRRRRPREVVEVESDLDRAPLTLPVTAPSIDPTELGLDLESLAPETT